MVSVDVQYHVYLLITDWADLLVRLESLYPDRPTVKERNLKQNESRSARAESTYKGVN